MMIAALNTTERGPKTTKAKKQADAAAQRIPADPTWDDLIAGFEACGVQPMADFIRSERERGTPLKDVTDGLVAFAADRRKSDSLQEVFDRAGDPGLTQDEIEYALDEVRAGVAPEAILMQIEGSRAAGSNIGWDQAVSARDTAKMAAEHAGAVADAAWERIFVDSPVPPGLEGKCTIEAIEASKLSLREKAALLPLLDRYNKARSEAKVRHDEPALERLADEAQDAADAAEDRLMNMQPPHLAGLVLQMREVLRRRTDTDPDTVEGMDRILAEDLDFQGTVYVHAVRLAGLARPEGWGCGFDVAGWIEAFEALPGHRLQVDSERSPARPDYADPVAWGADMPAYDDIRITDPAAIARYEEKVRSRYSDKAWEEELKSASAWVSRFGKSAPFVATDRQHVEYAYPNEAEPERVRLLAMLELRHQKAVNDRRPLGASLWSELAVWQSKLITDYVRQHPELFPENRHWTAETWMDAFVRVGGSLHADGDEVRYGVPYPPTAPQQRLIGVLDNNRGILKEQVQQLAMARQAAKAGDQ